MAVTISGVRGWITRHRVQSEALGVALLAVVVFVALGIKARRALEPASIELRRLNATSSEVTRFRSTFKPSTPDQEERLRRLSDSLHIVVPRHDRVALAHEIAERAELLGLSDVRVRFAQPDSATSPARPELSRTPVSVADYSLVVECSGRFAVVLTLVNGLPPSVALQRLVGGTGKTGTAFHLTLAVFEAPEEPSPAATGATSG